MTGLFEFPISNLKWKEKTKKKIEQNWEYVCREFSKDSKAVQGVYKVVK